MLGNPIRVNELARAFARNVTVDQYFQLDDLVRFALRVRRVGRTSSRRSACRATSDEPARQSVVLMDSAKAEPLFQALRNVEDPNEASRACQASRAGSDAWTRRRGGHATRLRPLTYTSRSS